MPKQLTKDQLWKLLEKLPQELKEAVFSGATSDNIWDICERYGIEDIPIVSEIVRDVLIGLLPPEDFQKELEKEFEIDEETSKQVTHEINRFVIYPVRPALEQLYNIGIKTPEKTKKAPSIEVPSEAAHEEKEGGKEMAGDESETLPATEGAVIHSSEPDKYRESTE